MMNVDVLRVLLNKYGIDPDIVLGNNENILIYGNYKDIENTIRYLVGELKINPKNIEKAPSILYKNVSVIRKNVDFLHGQDITFYNVETCLHVLSTVPWRLEETYNYVRDNYGLDFIDKNTSILGVDVERIKEIEKLGLDKRIVLTAAVSRLSIEHIMRSVIICRENNVEITSSLFRTNVEDIEQIFKACRENGIEITGSVFYRTADEIVQIAKVCRENGIEITGTIFLKSAARLQESINFIKEKYDASYLTSLIVVRGSKYLSEVFPYLEELGVLEDVKASASILNLKLEEIKERKRFVESLGETMVLENGRYI